MIVPFWLDACYNNAIQCIYVMYHTKKEGVCMKCLLSMQLLFFMQIASALMLTQDNLDEIDMRWRGIFDKQLAHAAIINDQAIERYKEHLLAITDTDIDYAEQLILRLCRGEAWDEFIQYKDKEAILYYIDTLTKALQKYIDPSCSLSFPPQLRDITQAIRTSDLTEASFCYRLRHAFLAFTIIVSRMNYIAQQ